jgi:RNA polymerase sigma-70 factor (ECF subfamily)
LRHALRLVGSPHQAEDITAIAFYQAWRRRKHVRIADGSIVAWLLVTTNNTVRNHNRQEGATAPSSINFLPFGS